VESESTSCVLSVGLCHHDVMQRTHAAMVSARAPRSLADAGD